MEVIVRVPQPETSRAIPMVAQLTVYGDHGQDGERAQLHVVVELKRPHGEPGKKQKMEASIVSVAQPEIVPAIQTVAQLTANGVHGQDGDPAQ